MSTITIVSVGTGNIQSVLNAFESLGHQVEIASMPGVLQAVEKIVLPGVGAFPAAMRSLAETGFSDALNEAVLVKQKPVLGICLGMQLLADSGTEVEEWPGLGWISGQVVAIDRTAQKLRIPHVGWNDLTLMKDCPVLAGLDQENDTACYFTHSYHLRADQPEDVSATTNYGHEITAAVSKGHIFGVQFHPEKSQRPGLKILRNFANV